MKYRNLTSKNKIYALIILFTFLIMGVGYAFLSSNLGVIGRIRVSKNRLNVHFENINIKSGSVGNGTASIDNSKTSINTTATLQNTGEYLSYSFEIVNDGAVDAMIANITKGSSNQYITYEVTYGNGNGLAVNNAIRKNTRVTVNVLIKCIKTVTTQQQFNMNLGLDFTKADGNAIFVNPICKRATTLHTEICNQTSNGCYSTGYTTSGSKGTSTITYGNLGTKGILKSGDAFDCDVNGDGIYNSTTERFYYVNNLDTDSNYAVLIYYNNVSKGLPTSTINYAYNTNTSTNLGPQTAMLQLPTAAQWNNVKLSNTTRNIKDGSGTIKVSNFSYSGYSARLLTYQEILNTCGSNVKGFLDSCTYLMENTKYSNATNTSFGPWLETVYSTDSAYFIGADNRNIAIIKTSSTYYGGVRPAIELKKSSIEY